MANTETKCLVHKKEYHSTMEGKSYWVCWFCGEVSFEMEDTGHGG